MNQKNTRRGFTLIELLVVVLIIGILAAVAVPQYNRAVMKSRLAEYETNLKAIALAEEACYLRKGSGCNKTELDIEIPECKPIPGIIDSCAYNTSTNHASVTNIINGPSGGNVLNFYLRPTETSYYGGGKMNDITIPSGMTCLSVNGAFPCEKLGFTQLLYNSSGYLTYIRP